MFSGGIRKPTFYNIFAEGLPLCVNIVEPI